MKEVFIISTAQIINGKTAGSQRVLNIARSLAAGGVNIFITSYYNIIGNPVELVELSPGINHLQSINKNDYKAFHLCKFIGSVDAFIKSRDAEKVLYLYPTVFIFRDFIYLLYFRIVKGYKLYCDVNELRATNAFTYSPPKRFCSRVYFFLRAFYHFLTYKLSELQVLFYNGIVVISTSLERYFSKFNRRILRIPILSDLKKLNDEKPPIRVVDTVFRMCFAGFINCRKEGFDTLFRALYEVNHNKHVELFLYGILIDQERQELNQLIDKFHLHDKVFYMGNIEPELLHQEFRRYDLLILPRPLSRQAKYGFSTKLSEYLTSGVPVLLTDVSDNGMYIKDSFNGFLIPPDSLSALVNKIIWIIDNYDDYSSMIAKNAFRTAREKFDYRIYTDTLINFLFKN